MTLSGLEFLVIVLAAYRGTRVLTTDEITEPPRDAVADWVERRNGRSDTRLTTLITCPFCAGWWLSIIAYVCAEVALGRVGDVPLLWHMIEAWGVIGGQALLSAVDGKLSH